jgi:hypothetical protein
MEITLNSPKPERTVQLELNQPQAEVNLVRANSRWLLWGRGTGKTVGGIAPFMVEVMDAMPGHLGGIFGKTFVHIETNILPKILLGLTELGYTQDVDYVVGRKPPEEFDKCLYPIKKYDKTIAWKNGTTFQEVGLHEKGASNAFDFQSGIFDEVKYQDPQQLEDEVYPTFRGFANLWGHLPQYLAKIYCTDKMGDFLQVKWILDMRKKMDSKKVATIFTIEKKLIELNSVLDDANSFQRNLITKRITALHHRANQLRKGLVHVSEASALDNIENLGIEWLADKKNRMKKYVFNVAILNKDPEQSQHGFYHGLSDACFYQPLYNNADLDPEFPLVIAMDYQHSVAPLCVCQVSNRINNRQQLNFINEFYTLYPHGIVEAVNLFCAYYQHIHNKRVHYIFDQTAIGKRPGAEPLYKIVINTLKANKWNVTENYMGDTPDHFDKYNHINDALIGDKAMPVQFNADKIIKTKISMQGASTKMTGGKTHKDKEYENAGKYPNIDQSETTHFSDVVDQIIWAVQEMKLINFKSFTSGIPLR